MSLDASPAHLVLSWVLFPTSNGLFVCLLMKSLKGNVVLNRFFICFVASIHGEWVFFLPLKIQGGFTEHDISQLASGEAAAAQGEF